MASAMWPSRSEPPCQSLQKKNDEKVKWRDSPSSRCVLFIPSSYTVISNK